MKAIELHEIFNKKYTRALRNNSVDKVAAKLVYMLNELNGLRLKEGTEPLSLPNLERRAIKV